MTVPTVLRCDLEYEVYTDTHFQFKLQASHGPDQRVLRDQLTFSDGLLVRESASPDSGDRAFRFDTPPGIVRIRYDAEVESLRESPDPTLAEMPVSSLPDAVFRYLMPSRYCESDLLSADAQALFGHVAPGYWRVQAICQWIRTHIAYDIGITGTLTSAHDVLGMRVGVCRDFAHLAIAFCRGLNIPARLVVGYVRFEEPPQDFHAVFEAWLGGRWVLFDPTELAPVESMVRVATGSDAKDTAFATIFGSIFMTHLHVQVNHDGSPPSDDPDPVQATVRRPVPAG